MYCGKTSIKRTSSHDGIKVADIVSSTSLRSVKRQPVRDFRTHACFAKNLKWMNDILHRLTDLRLSDELNLRALGFLPSGRTLIMVSADSGKQLQRSHQERLSALPRRVVRRLLSSHVSPRTPRMTAKKPITAATYCSISVTSRVVATMMRPSNDRGSPAKTRSSTCSASVHGPRGFGRCIRMLGSAAPRPYTERLTTMRPFERLPPDWSFDLERRTDATPNICLTFALSTGPSSRACLILNPCAPGSMNQT